MMGGTVRAWTHSVPFDEKAMVQNVASLPFVKPVAIMPDVHWGMGAGSVIPTEGAISTSWAAEERRSRTGQRP
jgi:RNA-splicing ligase RtcB